jgi:ectoine hydroxylase-related dioxygenase (phytanoyl-CoA dioxygenase family)
MNRRPLRPISDEDIKAYRRDGAVCLRQVFDRDWIDMLEPITRRMVVDKEDFGLLPHRPVNFMSRKIQAFRELIFNSPMGEACGLTMQSKEVRFLFDQIFAKEPHSTSPTVWHNDRAGWPVVGKMIPSFWMPLTPIVKANCLEVIAGSHRSDVLYWNSTANSRQMVKPDNRSNIPDGEAVRGNPDYRFLSWDMEPGDALLVHPWVLHYSSGNPTDGWRFAISIRPLGDDIHWDPRPECVNMAGISFDEMIPGEKAQGPMVPLIWSEDGRKDNEADFKRGFATEWAPDARQRIEATLKTVSYDSFAKNNGGYSSVPALSTAEDYF